MASYLVTGAAGFIGAAIAQRLLSGGHRVISIDNLSTGTQENLPDGVESYVADCQDPVVYERIPQIKYDAIFHIAGQSSGEISFDDPVYDLRTNAESTLCLLKFALNIECQRFIYASTMSVYGEKPDQPVQEFENKLPQSFYGVGKIASEHYLRLYQKYGIEPTSLRLFNVYGPGQNLLNLRQGMVSIYLAQLLENNHIHIKGSPTRYRDFVYIDDVVDSFIQCLDSPESIGRDINIATGTRTTVEELVKRLIKLHPQQVTYEFKGETPGDIHGIYADISLAGKLLNFKPKYTLDDGLKIMYAWAVSTGKETEISEI